jgi:tetratricopeptide (TPR) repeat protein
MRRVSSVRGTTDAAESLAVAAARALLDILGEGHPDYANALALAALVAEHHGRLHQAIDLGRHVLAILEPRRDVAQPIRASASMQLAYRLGVAGHHAEAEQLSREALALTSALHPFEAQAWISLGVSLHFGGRHDEAEAAYDRAVELYERADERIPSDLHRNLASLASARGDHGMAEFHARAALTARERSDAFAHGQNSCALGHALAGQGRASEAEDAYREGLACYTRAGRAEHVEVAFALQSLADVLAEQDRVAEAEACYEHALALERRLLGAAHHELAVSESKLAVLYARSGRLPQARALAIEAVVRVRVLPEHHPTRLGVEARVRSFTCSNSVKLLVRSGDRGYRRCMWSLTTRVGVLVLVLVAAGCDKGKDADEEVDPLGEEECVFDTTVIGPTDDPGLGFTAQDVLGNILGNYPDTLQWSAAEGPAYYVMPDTAVGVSIDVSFAAGEVRYVDANPSPTCDGACDESCTSRLEIDGTFALASEDGVLDESWSAVFTATAATEASFYVTFDPDQTQGTLSSESFVLADGSPIDTLIASGSIREGSTSGSIAVQIALGGEGGGYGVFEVGAWPP